MSSLVSISAPPAADAAARHVGDDATRRRLSPRQAATVGRLADALLAELATVDYDGLSVRSVARRAGVAPATAYTYFTSKAHLVAEVFWRRLRALPDTPLDPAAPAADRVGAVLHDVAALVAAEPALGAACSPALLGPDPDVRHLRDRIGAELHRRVAAALAPGDGPGPDRPARDPDLDALAEVVDLMLAGALLRAGTGHLPYEAIGDRLATLVHLVLGDRP